MQFFLLFFFCFCCVLLLILLLQFNFLAEPLLIELKNSTEIEKFWLQFMSAIAWNQWEWNNLLCEWEPFFRKFFFYCCCRCCCYCCWVLFGIYFAKKKKTHTKTKTKKKQQNVALTVTQKRHHTVTPITHFASWFSFSLVFF